MSSEFKREYLVKLPMPLAWLYWDAYHGKEVQARHNSAYYLLEAMIRLHVSTLVAAYDQEISGRSAPSEAALAELLPSLSRPTVGTFVGLLRELARHFGQREDSASHPLGGLWEQLSKKRNSAGLVKFFQRIRNRVDGKPSQDQTCSILELLDKLPTYRNDVIGHTSQRSFALYAHDLGPLLIDAVEELLEIAGSSLLGAPGSRLVSITDIRSLDENRRELSLFELVGERGERLPPVACEAEETQGLAPNRVAVLWPGRKVPMPIHPLLLWRAEATGDDLQFLNCDRDGKKVEYLSYRNGAIGATRDEIEALSGLLKRLLSSAPAKAGKMGRAAHDHASGAAREAGEVIAELERILGVVRTTGTQSGSSDEAASSQTNDYDLLAELGRGGMGVVYLARQKSLGRLVAYKRLSDNLEHDPAALARFEREIRHLARCDHPNVVRLLSQGMTDRRERFYTMEYVPGANLDNVFKEVADDSAASRAAELTGTIWNRAVHDATLHQREASVERPAGASTTYGGQTTNDTKAGSGDEKPAESPAVPQPPSTLSQFLPALPDAAEDKTAATYTRRIAELMRDAALAIQAVHDQGIVHRDVKPANLMVTPDGSRVVLMDFGLAKGADASASIAWQPSMGFLGTLRYAAPERLGIKMNVGFESDVYSLGVTMWELLARRRVFDSVVDEEQLKATILFREVPRLRTVDPTIDPDLEAIVVHATKREPGERIPTARALADYLQLYLDGKPIPLRVPGPIELVRKWVRRNQGTAAAIAASAASIVVAIVVAFLLITRAWSQSVRAENEAILARNEAIGARNEAIVARNEAIEARNEKASLAERNERLAEDEAAARAKADQERKQALALLDTMCDELVAPLGDLSSANRNDPVWKKYYQRRVESLNTGLGKILQNYPEYDRVLQIRAVPLAELTGFAAKDNKRELTLSLYAQTQEVAEKIAERKDDAQAMKYATLALGLLVQPLRELQCFEQAHRAGQRALELAELVKPSADAGITKRRAYLHEALAETFTAQKDHAQAVAEYSEALRIIKQAEDEAESKPDRTLQNETARLLINCAKCELRGDNAGAAVDYAEQAKDIRIDLWKANDSFASRGDLAYAFDNLARVYLQAKNLDKARSACENLIRARRGLIALPTAVVDSEVRYDPDQAQRNLTDALVLKADIEADLGDAELADKSHREAISTARLIKERNPSVPNAENLAWALGRLSSFLSTKKRGTEAIPFQEEARDLRSRLASSQPNDAAAQRNWASACSRLASLYNDAHRAADAVKVAQERTEVCRSLCKNSENAEDQDRLSDSLGSLSFYYLFDRKPAEAKAAAEEALKMHPEKLWIATNLGHAHLFEGAFDHAKRVYLADANKVLNSGKTFADEVRADYKLLREAGVSHADMQRIEALLPASREAPSSNAKETVPAPQ